MHIFNYTNYAKFLSGHDTKLKVQDIGPYIYKERVEKVNIVYEENKITYNVCILHLKTSNCLYYFILCCYKMFEYFRKTELSFLIQKCLEI